MFLAGCQYSANADRFLNEKPSVDRIVGNYTLREQSVYLEKPSHDFSRSSILLRTDYTCVLVEYPLWDETLAQHQSIPNFYTGPGKFSIKQTGMVSGLPNDKPCFGVLIEIPGKPAMRFTFANHGAKLELVNEFGDPDQWIFTCWIKES